MCVSVCERERERVSVCERERVQSAVPVLRRAVQRREPGTDRDARARVGPPEACPDHRDVCVARHCDVRDLLWG